MNVIRYHQGGWANGTITVGGETYELGGEAAFGFRDHSWGIRQGVGVAPSDLIRSTRAPDPARAHQRGIMKWTPSFFRRSDGSYYETAIFVTGGEWDYSSAFVNSPDGTQARVRIAEPRMEYDTRTRFVRRGELHLVMETGEERTIEVEAVGESGFFLKTAGYGSGRATSTAHGRDDSIWTASTSPTAGTTTTWICSASSGTRPSGCERATPSATGSWRAS